MTNMSGLKGKTKKGPQEMWLVDGVKVSRKQWLRAQMDGGQYVGARFEKVRY
jgi:hypothetical protein